MTGSLARLADVDVARGLTWHDACYAALAEDIGGCLLTCDRKAHQMIRDARASWLLDGGLPGEWP